MPSLFACFLFLIYAAHGSAARPNIVMIISDDQTYRDFGFMGNNLVHTPHLDKLAEQSAFFPNGYVPTSVCSPSLATMLTGLYPHQHGIHYNHPPPGNSAFNKMKSRTEYERIRSKSFYLIKSVDTLPRLLAKQGYKSLQTGKFWEGHYRNGGFTEGMTIFKPPLGQKFGGVRTLAGDEKAAHGNGDWGLKIGRQTMKPIYNFIDACAGQSPFFIWYAPYLPHQPHDSPKKYFDLYQNNPKVPENFIPYYAAISQFDDTVGNLVNYVEGKGLAGNTLFVFVVDNGWTPSMRRHKTMKNFFHHTRESKRAPFEDGLRTPILFRWDKQITPARHELLCSSIDIAPTLLQLTGQSQKANTLPGINLLDAETRKSNATRAVFGEIYPGDANSLGHPSQDIAYRWMRQGDFKLIIPQGKKPWGNYLNKPALFNLGPDPGEKENLHLQAYFRTRVKTMERLLDKWWIPGNDADVPKPPAN